MAPRLTLQEIERYREEFTKYADADETLDMWRLRDLLAVTGQDGACTDEELFRLVAQVDQDHTGRITFDEFLFIVEVLKDGASGYDGDRTLFAAWTAAGGSADKTGEVRLSTLRDILQGFPAIHLRLESAYYAQLQATRSGMTVNDTSGVYDWLLTNGPGLEWSDFAALLAGGTMNGATARVRILSLQTIAPIALAMPPSAQEQSDSQSKVSGELFALTFGCFAAQLLQDSKFNTAEANAQLERHGYNIGIRFVDELVANSNIVGHTTFEDFVNLLATKGFQMLFNVSAQLTMSDDRHAATFRLKQGENPLVGWAELPSSASDLCFSRFLAGICRGALEMAGLYCTVTVQQDPLCNPRDGGTEIHIRLNAQGGIQSAIPHIHGMSEHKEQNRSGQKPWTISAGVGAALSKFGTGAIVPVDEASRGPLRPLATDNSVIRNLQSQLTAPKQPSSALAYQIRSSSAQKVIQSRELEHSMRTSDDAIQFFSSAPSDCPLRLVHCLPSTEPHGDFICSPFELVIVPVEQALAANEYYVISAQGVSRIDADGNAESYSLSDWSRQARIYNACRMLPFFRFFIQRKSFTIWQHYCLHRRKQHYMAQLESDALLTNTHFVKTLQIAARLCHQASQLELIALFNQSGIQATSLDEFLQMQQSVRDRLSESEHMLTHSIQTALAALENDLTTISQQSEEIELDGLEYTPEFLQQALNARPLIAARAAVLRRRTEIQEANIAISRFPRLLSCIERMLQQSLCAAVCNSLIGVTRLIGTPLSTQIVALRRVLARNSGESLTMHIEAPEREALTSAMKEQGMSDEAISLTLSNLPSRARTPPQATEGQGSQLLVLLQFTETDPGRCQLIVKPTEEEVQDAFRVSVTQVLMLLTPVSQIASALTQYLPLGYKPRAGDVSGVLGESDLYVDTVQALSSEITKDYEAVEQFVHKFDQFAPIFLFGQTFNHDEFVAQASNISLAELRTQFNTYSSWQQALSVMPSSMNAGLLRVDARRLRDQVSTVPDSAIAALHQAAILHARTAGEEVIQISRAHARALANVPHTLGEYIEFVGYLRSAREEAAVARQRVAEMTELIVELQNRGVAIPAQDLALSSTVDAELATLQTSLQAADSVIQQKHDSMLAALQQEVNDAETRAATVMSDISRPPLTEAATSSASALERVAILEERLNGVIADAERLKLWSKEFNTPVRGVTGLGEIQSLVTARRELWQARADFTQSVSDWMRAPFSSLSADEVTERVSLAAGQASRFMSIFHDDAVVAALSQSLTEFKRHLPLIQDLCLPAMQQRHWDRVMEIVVTSADKAKTQVHPGDAFTLQDLLSWGAFRVRSLLADVAAAATGEAALLASIQQIDADWADQEFTIVPFEQELTSPRTRGRQNDTQYYLLSGVDDLMLKIEDSQSSLAAMRVSRYLEGVAEDVGAWESRITTLAALVDVWLSFQKNWLYLDSVFSQPDIQRQLPAESTIFAECSVFWHDFGSIVQRGPRVLTVEAQCHGPQSLIAQLRTNLTELENAQHGLEDYLDTKRQVFGRLYFLSNDELLVILSKSRDPETLQPQIRKCFEGVASVGLDQSQQGDWSTIVSLVSPERERLSIQPVAMNGPVEYWLGQLEKSMRAAVQNEIELAYQEEVRLSSTAMAQLRVDSNRDVLVAEEHLPSYFSRPVLATLQAASAVFTSMVEIALNLRSPLLALRSLLAYQQLLIDELVRAVRTELTPLQRSAVATRLTEAVHQRDIIRQLGDDESRLGLAQTEHCRTLNWYKQLRTYFVDGVMTAQIFSASFEHAGEYIGSPGRLVITPLTDRCYQTLTTALSLCLGGAPQGPAGTGKTETAKDLARTLGRFCVVFNASQDVQPQITGQLLCGVALSGGWCTIDEVNRLRPDVLSVLAQQLRAVLDGLRAQARTVQILGQTISLSPICGLFVTLNPGYTGRAELPDNLKALFRPIAMVAPDSEIIAEVCLFEEGFRNANQYASKIVQLYQLSAQQLSDQPHYDFGLRAIKPVLLSAGELMRAGAEDEGDVVVRAICQTMIPKLPASDQVIFRSILKSVFPDCRLEDSAPSFEQEIRDLCRKYGYSPRPVLLEKATQLMRTLSVRHGAMLVGEPRCGKTTCAQLVAEALGTECPDIPESISGVVDVTRIFPKVLSMGELYGTFTEATRAWQDGLLPAAVRQAPPHAWIWFDGSVDSLWIENMNSVLDDNRLLCLASNERIRLDNSLRLIFETDTLEMVSPATISRCGMVYFERAPTWGQTCTSAALRRLMDSEIADHLATIFGDQTAEAAAVAQDISDLACESFEALETAALPWTSMAPQRVRSFVAIYDGLLSALPIPQTVPRRTLLRFLVFAITWAFGGTLPVAQHEQFSALVREVLPKPVVDTIPDDKSVFDIRVDSQGSFLSWQVPQPDYKSDVFATIVPTRHLVSHAAVLRLMLAHSPMVTVLGPHGCGKSVLLDYFLSEKEVGITDTECTIPYCSMTGVHFVLDSMEGQLKGHHRDEFSPPPGTRLLFVHDHPEISSIDEANIRPIFELLRHISECGGTYERKTLAFRRHVNIRHVVMASPDTPPARSLASSTVVTLEPLSDDECVTIFGSQIGRYFQLHLLPEDSAGVLDCVVPASLSLFHSVQAGFRPRPVTPHYTFSTADLRRLIASLTKPTPETLETRWMLGQLWVHEACRTFRDRLVNTDDTAHFDTLLCEALDSEWHVREWQQPPDSEQFVCEPQSIIGRGDVENLLWGRWASGQSAEYRPLSDPEFALVPGTAASRPPAQLLAGTVTRQSGLVFSSNFVAHVSRTVRALTQGHALLVGAGGSGRSTVLKTAAEVNGMTLWEPDTSGSTAWRDELKAQLQEVVLSVRGATVLVASDARVTDSAIWEDICALMGGDEVAGLWTPEERALIDHDLTKMVQPGSKEPPPTVRSQLQAHLHVALLLQPGDELRVLLRSFPTLLSQGSMDWFTDWTEETLHEVGHSILSAMLDPPPNIDQLVTIATRIHMDACEEAARQIVADPRSQTTVSPSSLIALLRQYESLNLRHGQKIVDSAQLLGAGLEKMLFTQSEVERMQAELKVMAPQLEELKETTERLVVSLSKDEEVVAASRAVVAEETAAVEDQAQAAGDIRDEAQAKLDTALPAFEAAVRALDALNKNDITIIRSFTSPPEGVRKVMEAVLILLGQTQPTWAEAKKVLADQGFLKRLQQYDKDNVPPAVLRRVRKYTTDETFTPEVVEHVSTAACSLCMWVKAIDRYTVVAADIAPLRQSLAEAEASLKDAQERLSTKQAELEAMEQRLLSVRGELAESNAKREQLVAQQEMTKRRLERAVQLASLLTDEQDSWSKQHETLLARQNALQGDMLLAAAVICYAGALPEGAKLAALARWHRIVEDAGVAVATGDHPLTDLVPDEELANWQDAGLPSDLRSVSGAAAAMNSVRVPLLVDPDGEATGWLRQLGHILLVDADDRHLMRSVRRAIGLGQPIVVTNCGERVPIRLLPLLRDYSAKTVRLAGDAGEQATELTVQAGFRLILASEAPHPSFPLEVRTSASLIYFAPTYQTVQEQLLTETVTSKHEQLETQRRQTQQELTALQRQLAEQRMRLLEALAGSEGNILDDDPLLAALQQSHDSTLEVKRHMQDAQAVAARIEETRQLYATVAERGALTFFVAASLSAFSPLYSMTLSQFRRLFSDSLRTANSPRATVDALIAQSTTMIVGQVSASIHSSHRMGFLFVLAATVQRAAGLISPLQWQLLSAPPDSAEAMPDTWPACLAVGGSRAVAAVALLDEDVFHGALANSLANPNEAGTWLLWQRQPRADALPPALRSASPFVALLLALYLSPANALSQVSQYAQDVLQLSTLKTLRPAVTQAVRRPGLILTCPGTDALKVVTQYLSEQPMPRPELSVVDLGHGQGPYASAAIQTAVVRGNWVMLQNIELAPDWLAQLPEFLKTAEAGAHQKYRLWLSATSDAVLPPELLQISQRIFCEAPVSFAALITEALSAVGEELFMAQTGCAWHRLVYSVCLFFAVLHSRARVGAIGFSQQYVWTLSDVTSAVSLMRSSLPEGEATLPHDHIAAISAIVFGGHVTNGWDQRVMQDLLDFVIDVAFTDQEQFTAFFPDPELSFTETLAFAGHLPEQPPSELLGLSTQTMEGYSRAVRSKLLECAHVHTNYSTFLDIPAGSAVSGGETEESDECAARAGDPLPAALAALAALPEERLVVRAEESEELDPLVTFLARECQLCNQLLDTIASDCAALREWLAGNAAEEPWMAEVSHSLVDSAIPLRWRYYPSTRRLAAWIPDLTARFSFLQTWAAGETPTVFRMNLFFDPRAFITATLLSYSQRSKASLDQISLTPVVVDGDAPEDSGPVISGLYLQGSSLYDENGSAHIVCTDDKADPTLGGVQAIPHLLLSPSTTPVQGDAKQGFVPVPIYITAMRGECRGANGPLRDLVTTLNFACSDPMVATLRGTAFLLDTPPE